MRWIILALAALTADAGHPGVPKPAPAEPPPLSRRFELLRPGDSRQRIEALLGRAADEWTQDGPFTVLDYPNPAAPPDLKPEQRRILLYLDVDGLLLFTFDLSVTC